MVLGLLGIGSVQLFFVFISFFFFFFFWLFWVFLAECRLSLVAVSGDCSSLQCVGLLWWILLLQSMGLQGMQASVVAAPQVQNTGSVLVAHGLSCLVVCGIYPDQGSNPCPPDWQVGSYPQCHQGSPVKSFLGVCTNGKKNERVQSFLCLQADFMVVSLL